MDQNRDLARQWLDGLAAERGASPGTLATYQIDLDCYLGFLGERPLPSVKAEDVRSFLAYLDERAFSGSTISRRRSVARSLHRFLLAEGLAEHDPTTQLQPAKHAKKLPVLLTVSEVDRLLEGAHAKAADDTWGLYRQAGFARRAALLETLYASGMRVSEAVNLKTAALHPGHAFLMVKGKGAKERMVPLHARAVKAIKLWRDLASAYGSGGSDWLFHATRSGEAPLTRQAAVIEIKEAALDAGLSRIHLISPHKLRHAFASHLLANGATLRDIQEMLGHADLGSTEVYTHVAINRAAEMVFDLHPLSERSG
jgi:integrase/recombinase XerD